MSQISGAAQRRTLYAAGRMLARQQPTLLRLSARSQRPERPMAVVLSRGFASEPVSARELGPVHVIITPDHAPLTLEGHEIGLEGERWQLPVSKLYEATGLAGRLVMNSNHVGERHLHVEPLYTEGVGEGGGVSDSSFPVVLVRRSLRW